LRKERFSYTFAQNVKQMNRKPVDRKHCTQAGFVKKTHGVKGDMLIIFDKSTMLNTEEPEFIFIETQGLLVPFMVEETEWRNDDELVVKLKFIDNKELAGQYIGCNVFANNELIIKPDETFNPHMLKGFMLSDTTLGEIGPIDEVNDYNGNLVLSVPYNGNEILIPYNDELLVAFDADNRTIELNCPEGLFDMDEE
jgi:16S rRNA processing protein RimM